MKKLLTLSALLVAAIAPASAMALDTDAIYDVSVRSGRNDVSLGYWELFLDQSRRDTCVYSLEWTSNSDDDDELAISTECVVEELKTHRNRSCLSNANRFFDTVITQSYDSDCMGFDIFGLAQDVDLLVMSENRGGELTGVVLFDGPADDIYSIQADAVEHDDDLDLDDELDDINDIHD